MTQPRPTRLMSCLAALVIGVLVVFFAIETLLFFVFNPSRSVAVLFPICHYGILTSLFVGLVLVTVEYVGRLRRRRADR